MGKSIGLAYSIAGAAVAAAVIVIAGSTVGFDRGEASPADTLAAQAAADPAAIDAALAAGVARSEIVQGADGQQVEYVYVDAPASNRGHDDDDDDDHEEHERREHKDHDDDD